MVLIQNSLQTPCGSTFLGLGEPEKEDNLTFLDRTMKVNGTQTTLDPIDFHYMNDKKTFKIIFCSTEER